MLDLDLLYDYYKDNNLAAAGYAAIACRTKDDGVEKVFRQLADTVLKDARDTSRLIIKLGGEIY